MIIDNIELTETEKDILIERMAHPVVKKYLSLMYNQQAMIAATGSPDGQSSEEFLRKRAQVQGAMRVFQTLLEINVPQPEISTE